MNTHNPSTATPNGTRARYARPRMSVFALVMAILLAALGARPAAAAPQEVPCGLYAGGNVTFERVKITGNKGFPGGGVGTLPSEPANFTFIDSTISGNGALVGGGIHFWATDDRYDYRLTLIRTTISGNSATLDGGALALGDLTPLKSGGGVNMHCQAARTCVLDIRNSTLSGNTAGSLGGAVVVAGSGSAVSISDSTLTGNSATGSDAYHDYTGVIGAVWRSIVAGNGLDSVNDCGGDYNDISNFDIGYNLFGPGCRTLTTGAGTIVLASGADAWLGPLADNGGLTKTHLPRSGSPALDMIPAGSAGCTPGATDQRGVTRPQGSGCDIGAVEVEAPSVGDTFSGFLGSVDNPPIVNVANAERTIPLQWRLTDASGAPLTNLTSVTVTSVAVGCSAGAPADTLEEYAATNSGLQNLGDGYYQYNWSTQRTWAGCRTLLLDLGDGQPRTALFQFR